MSNLESQIQGWCRDGVVSQAGNGALDIHGSDGRVVRANVLSVLPDEAQLHVTWTASGVGASFITDLVRTARLVCAGMVRLEAGDGRIEITVPLYLDGLSRHSFLGAAADIGHAYEVLTSSAAAIEDNRASIEAAQRALKEVDDLIAEGEQARAEMDQARAAAGMELEPAAWTATHVVPQGGLSAWASPDGSAAPAAMLAAGTELQVLEQQGDWVHVAASNSWTGWVDARVLSPLA